MSSDLPIEVPETPQPVSVKSDEVELFAEHNTNVRKRGRPALTAEELNMRRHEQIACELETMNERINALDPRLNGVQRAAEHILDTTVGIGYKNIEAIKKKLPELQAGAVALLEHIEEYSSRIERIQREHERTRILIDTHYDNLIKKRYL